MNTRIEYEPRPKRDRESLKQAKKKRQLAQASAHKVGPGKRNIVLEHRRVRENLVHNAQRANDGKYSW